MDVENKMDLIRKIEIENGCYYFKLGKILNERHISLNKLMRDTDTDFKVIKRLITGELSKLDMIVLARFCNYLNCSIKDIVDYEEVKSTTKV